MSKLKNVYEELISGLSNLFDLYGYSDRSSALLMIVLFFHSFKKFFIEV